MAPGTPARVPQPDCDVFVDFGITGDLAKVMTFRSLYRLERRGLLQCPIVGVAGDDWTVDQLVERARTSIVATGEALDEEVFARLAARFSYVQGDFADAATYQRLAKALEAYSRPGVLPGDPAVPLRHRDQGHRRRRAHGARPGGGGEAVRPRPRLGPGAGRRAAPVRGRVAALPDRPLPREDGPRGDPLPALRQHDAGAGVEPELRVVGADHDGRELRGGRPRPLLRPGGRAARRGGEPPHAGGGGHGHGAPCGRQPREPEGRDRGRLPRRQRRRSRALRAGPVRRLPRRRRGGGRLGHRDVRRAAPRDRQLALVGRALLHPHRQVPRHHRDRGAAGVQAPAPPGLRGADGPAGRPQPAGGAPRPRHRGAHRPRRPPGQRAGPGTDLPDMQFAARAARARPPTRCCCTRR